MPNSAPVVGTPLNGTAFGIPLGGETRVRACAARGTVTSACAAFIRAGVQNASAARCAAALT